MTALFIAAGVRAGKDYVIVDTVQLPGFSMVLHGDNYLEQEIVDKGTWEPSTTQFFKSTLQSGQTVIDIGANIGYFSLLSAALVGPIGEVHAFEPYPGYVERMKLSLEANDFSNIRLNEFALSDKRETHKLFKGLASARMHPWTHENPVFNKIHDEVDVDCICFDDYADEKLKRLDLIKIDVDGYELNVLRGARKSIKKYHPIIVIEIFEEALRDSGSGAGELLGIFQEWGYQPYSEQGQLFEYKELLTKAIKNPKISMNVVFRPGVVPVRESLSKVTADNCFNPMVKSVTAATFQSPNKLKLGLVINRPFHEENRWCSATTFHLVEALKSRFDCVYIQSQQDYEAKLGDVDVLISMEPGWAAPVLELSRTEALRERLSSIPSYILYSDPHANKWRQEYFLKNRLDYVLAFYHAPFRYHFTEIQSDRLIHFPWAIPDHWISNSPIVYQGQRKICCFGGQKSEAYELRNWCRGFEFVESATNSGVENKVMSESEYIDWLKTKDAAIAAGSESPKYKLTVPKYFEIAASGSLLFAQQTDDLALLGFEHKRNCIIFDKSNFEQLAKEYLSNPESYLQIRQAGREFIRQRHSLSQRMKFLVEHVSTALEQKAKGRGFQGAYHGDLSEADSSGQLVNGFSHADILEGPNAQKTIATTIPVNHSEMIVADSGRKKVLFIVDSPDWAHDFKTNNLIRCLGDSYDIKKLYDNQVTAEDIDNSDLVVIYYWYQIQGLDIGDALEVLTRNKHKLLFGICSHHEMRGADREKGLRILRHLASGIFVNSMLLYKEFAPCFDVPVFYSPNGVDTEFYTPALNKRTGEKLRAGWAGSVTNHGNKRGYHEFILPSVEGVERVELAVASREEKWRGPEEMREFYRSLDVYICASITEGTPNPCLEAAACGVPLLTTRVGNMPQLVQNGINGLFIERDIKDIKNKLMVMRDNPRLREHMSETILESIRKWDWKHHAENYRVMFDAMLAAGDSSKVQLFKSESQVYLASADRMDQVLNNVSYAKAIPFKQVDTYATVIGGLSGLNYLTEIEPHNVVFYDINISAIDYARCIVELIRMSETPHDFISRIFCRSIEKFLRDCGQADLTLENQQQYILRPVDESLLKQTLSLLSNEAIHTYRKYIMPHLSGEVLPGVRNCRRLLPCWPVNERVPVGGGEETGCDQNGQRVPNTNTFFYGHGWLTSQESFTKVRRALEKSQVSFRQFDLLKEDISCLGDLSGSFVLYASNIDEWFPQEWQERLKVWYSGSLSQQGLLAVIGAVSGVMVSDADAHKKALVALYPRVYGKVIEVTHKVPWGFNEFERKNVRFDDYLKQDYPADTTILHILIGEGLSRDIFQKVYVKALRLSKRVIILEHNRDSADFAGKDNSRFVTVAELQELIENTGAENHAVITCAEPIAGQSDSRRNMIFVIDIASAESHSIIADDAAAPKFSIIMANYNNSRYIAEAIDSVTNQTFTDWELIIVDDCSTDNSCEFISRYLGDVRIRLIKYETNKGYTSALKTGISNVRSEFFGVMDSDDCLRADAIELMYHEHCDHPEAGLIYSQFVRCDEDLKPLEMGFGTAVADGMTNLDRFVASAFRTFKLRDYSRTGGYDENILYAEDKDICYKMEEVSKLRFIDEILYFYRALPGSQSHDSAKAVLGRQMSQMARFNAFKRRGLKPVAGIAQDGEKKAFQLRDLQDCYRLGLHHFEGKKYEEAEQVFSAVLESGRKFVKHVQTGRTSCEADRFAWVLECIYDSSLKLAHCYFERNKLDLAVETYAQLLEADYLKISAEQRNAVSSVMEKLESKLVLTERPPEEKTERIEQTRDKEPLVSVIMPAYNAQKYIRQAIESVLIQNYRHFELIIINDGSTDSTEEIVFKFKDERIRYFKQQNRGLAATHNEGIRKSRGEFLIKVDVDDFIAVDFIGRHLKEFYSHRDADLIYCDDYLVEEDGKPIRIITRPEYTDRKMLIRDLFSAGFPVIPFRTCIRRRVFDEIGLFDESLLIGEDYDMMRRFVKAGLKAQHLKAPLYYRRLASDSLSRQYSVEKARAHFEIVKSYAETFSYEELFPDVQWEQILPGMRQLHFKCLVALNFISLGQKYIKTNLPSYAQTALVKAGQELNECLQIDPGNGQVQQLLEKCRGIEASLSEPAILST